MLSSYAYACKDNEATGHLFSHFGDERGAVKFPLSNHTAALARNHISVASGKELVYGCLR